MAGLTSRPRVRAAVTRAAHRALAAVGEDGRQKPAPEPEPRQPGASHRFARAVPLGQLSRDEPVASDTLYERLTPEDLTAVEARVAEDPALEDMLKAYSFDPLARRRVLLALGNWLAVEGFAERTGLPLAQPPESVHAMARGALSGAGGMYEADMILSSVLSAGRELGDIRAGLDFGCSSGRVARVLAAVLPDSQWHGCDPNDGAIAWASENLPGIEFFVNGDNPPLPLGDGALDLICAISIWSHFEPRLGLTWFDEMHRLLRPGGLLVMTTHGFTSVAFYAAQELRSPRQSDEIAGELYRAGAWYRAEFGEQGDWGVTNPDWGTAFLAPEWLLAHLCPRWRFLEFAAGRNQENQDVYVLERA